MFRKINVFNILNEIENVESLDDKKINILSKKARILEKDMKEKQIRESHSEQDILDQMRQEIFKDLNVNLNFSNQNPGNGEMIVL